MLDKQTKKYIDDSFKKIYKRFKIKELSGMNVGSSSTDFNEDKDGGGQATFKKEGKWYKVADYIKARLGVLVYGNYVMEGYSTGRGVIRSIQLQIEPGATPNTDINVTHRTGNSRSFNYPSINGATNLARGGTSGSFSLNAGGTDLTMDITEVIIGVLGAMMVVCDLNSSSTLFYSVFGKVDSGNLVIQLYPTGNISASDYTDIFDAGDSAYIQLIFITST